MATVQRDIQNHSANSWQRPGDRGRDNWSKGPGSWAARLRSDCTPFAVTCLGSELAWRGGVMAKLPSESHVHALRFLKQLQGARMMVRGRIACSHRRSAPTRTKQPVHSRHSKCGRQYCIAAAIAPLCLVFPKHGMQGCCLAPAGPQLNCSTPAGWVYPHPPPACASPAPQHLCASPANKRTLGSRLRMNSSSASSNGGRQVAGLDSTRRCSSSL